MKLHHAEGADKRRRFSRGVRATPDTFKLLCKLIDNDVLKNTPRLPPPFFSSPPPAACQCGRAVPDSRGRLNALRKSAYFASSFNQPRWLRGGGWSSGVNTECVTPTRACRISQVCLHRKKKNSSASACLCMQAKTKSGANCCQKFSAGRCFVVSRPKVQCDAFKGIYWREVESKMTFIYCIWMLVALLANNFMVCLKVGDSRTTKQKCRNRGPLCKI